VALEYPEKTIWFVQASLTDGADKSEGSAVAIRLQKSGTPKTAKTYLLTCGHVVRGTSSTDKAPGFGQLLPVIRAWPPDTAFNEKQAKKVQVYTDIKSLPAGELSREERLNVADDWVVLDLLDGQAAMAAPSVGNWAAETLSGDFRIYGFVGGSRSFPRDKVLPTRTPDAFPFRDESLGSIILTGDGTRPGISGGGVFGTDDLQFAGIHRARYDEPLQLIAVSSFHIQTRLLELGYEPTKHMGSGRPRPTGTKARVARGREAVLVTTTNGDKLQKLRDFLKGSFDLQEFEIFLSDNNYADVAHAVGKNVGNDTYFFNVIKVLDRQGLIVGEFFDRLIKARPKKAAIVQSLRQICLDEKKESPQPSDTSAPIVDQNLTGAESTASTYLVPEAPVQKKPSSLQSLLVREKTKNFVGRGFAFDFFDQFLSRNTSGYIIVEGVPGIGKSSLLAEFVRRFGAPAHFNVRAEGIVRVSQFVESLHLQLGERFGLDRALPENAAVDGRHLKYLLTESEKRLPPGERLVIVVDALDEVETPAIAGANTLFLPTSLPAGVFFVVSRRSRTAVLQVEANFDVLDLMAHAAENRDDAEQFIRLFLGKPTARARLGNTSEFETLVNSLLDRSENNFMYLHYVLNDIEQGRLRDGALRDLPRGLRGYYERHWERMTIGRADDKPRFRTIYALAELGRPAPASLLASCIGETELTVHKLLDEWAQFLEIGKTVEQVGEKSVQVLSLYHQSFADFLMEKGTVQAAKVDLGDLRRRIGDGLLEGFDLDE
jgi:hypothetical protein